MTDVASHRLGPGGWLRWWGQPGAARFRAGVWGFCTAS